MPDIVVNNLANDEEIGVIQTVYETGKHGPYCFVRVVSHERDLSMSLLPPVWNENRIPQRGEVVIVSNPTCKRAGWRFNKGRYLKPNDVSELTLQQTLNQLKNS